MPNLNPYK